jgi:hypothetical protein
MLGVILSVLWILANFKLRHYQKRVPYLIRPPIPAQLSSSLPATRAGS